MFLFSKSHIEEVEGRRSMAKIRIVKAREENIPQIVENWKEYMDHNSDIYPYFKRGANAHVEFERSLRAIMVSKKSLILVALDGDILVGHSIAEIAQFPQGYCSNTDYGHILEIGVRTKYRGKGIGTMLFNRMIAWFKERGIKRVESRTEFKNDLAQSFWRGKGFRGCVETKYKEL
jgi:GNAT superfamily N-acetyltransferase